MKKIITLLNLFTVLVIAQEKQPLTLEEIFSKKSFEINKIENFEWQPNGEAFTYTKINEKSGFMEIYKHEVKSGINSILVSSKDLVFRNKQIKLSDYQWTQNNIFILLQGPSEAIWRHSKQAPYFLYNISSKSITPLANESNNLRNVKLSPNGKMVGYVKNHNLYYADLESGKETKLTNDGNSNILNGEFDWVYEEEFGLADAWRWSHDSKKIAFWKFDQSRVKEFNLIDEIPYYNVITKLKYPKVGEENSIVKIGVVEIESGKINMMDIGKETDIYIPRIFWTNTSDKLSIIKLNRKQDRLEMLLSNTDDGNSKVIIEDSDPCWIDVQNDISFLKSKDQIVFSSESNGYRHAYLYDYEGNLIRQITNGNWEITEIVGVDEENELLYFYGKKDSPIEKNIYRVNLNGKNLEKISQNAGWHEPHFSPDYKYYINYYSSVTTPTKTLLNNSDGSNIRVIHSGDIPALKNHNMVYPEFLTITTDDNVKLNAYMIKPYNFDENKKYRVIVYGYGGPGSQQVVNKWGNERTHWHQYLTEQDYIIFCLDNRGTGGRGKEFKNLAYGDLSKWSVNDQIEGAKYLASLPYVDKDRIGFWGWSGGGYLTIALLTKAADYFSTGVSVAPVTDFFTYDAIFAERVMNLPKNNPDGYAKSNLNNFVEGLKGNLLIIHGTGDDNVHFQNTMLFVDKCVEKNKQLDIFLYPNRNHRITGGNTQLHLFTKIRDYFNKNL